MLSAVAKSCGAAAAALGLLSLAGWVLGIPFLASPGQNWISMAPSTALLCVALGTAVYLGAQKPLVRAGRVAGIAGGSGVALIGLLLLVNSYLGITLELEHLGLPNVGTVNGVHTGHMSPVVALCFLLGGISLATTSMSDARRPLWAMAGFWLAGIVLLASGVFLLAHLYGTPLLDGAKFLPPALTTSVALAACALALVAMAAPRAWITSLHVDTATLRASISFVLVFVLMAAGMVLAGAIYFNRSVAAHRVQAEHELSAVADLKVGDLLQWRRERLGNATRMRRSEVFAGLVRQFFADSRDANSAKELYAWLQQVREVYAYEAVFLMDRQGVVRIAVPQNPASESEIESALRALQADKIIFEDFHQDEPGGTPHLSILVPVPDQTRHGRPLAVVRLEIDPAKHLYPSLERWPAPSATAETVLVRRDGDDVLFLNELRFRKNTASTLRFPLAGTEVPAAKAVLGEQGIVEGTDYRGVQVIAALRRVPGTPWFLLAKMDTAEFMESINESLWLTAALVAALLLAAGAAVGLIWRHQRVRHYRERLHGAEALAQQKDLYNMLSQTNQAIVRMTSREELFPAVCRIAVEYGHFRFAWIRVTGDDGRRLVLAAKYGEDVGYVDQLRVSADADDPTGRGPVGQAFRTGKHSISNDFLDDPATAPWHAAALGAGVRSSAALPIRQGGRIIGVIVLSAGQRRFFTEALMPTLDDMAVDISFALDNFDRQAALARTVEALRTSELRYRQLFEANPHPMWVYDLQTLRFLAVNDAAVAHYGFSRDEFEAMSIADIRPPEDVPRLLESVARVQVGKAEKTGVWRHRKKDGTLIDVEIAAQALEFDGRRAEMVLVNDITERLRAESAVREGEVRYRSLFENMLDGYAHCRMEYDGQGRPVDFIYLDVNAAFYRLTGLPDAIGRRVSEIIPGIREQSPDLFETYGRVASTGVPETFELDFRPLDRWLTVSVYSQAKGEFIALFDDITERRRAQLALTESETRYRSLFEYNNMATLLIDPESGRIVDANRAACAFYGWDLATLKGMAMFEINTMDPDRLVAAIARARESKQAFNFRHRLAGGEIRDVEVFSGPVEIGGRKLLLSIVHDVTESMRTRRELVESEQQFRGLVEQAIAGIYILEEGRLTYANPRFAGILGYGSAEELMGRGVLSITAEEEREAVAHEIRRWNESGQPNLSLSFTALRKDGTTVDVGVHGARATRAGRPVVIGLMQDISEKKRAEDQVKRHVAQLEAAFMSTVEVATTLSEMRDPYTAGHERRVAEIAVAIGGELGFDERRREGLRVAGHLHDVGKITVPAEILAKPTKLTAIEYALIKAHAQASYDVLKNVEFPWPVAQVALQHHERMDGSGYPQGLKGEEILFEARILAVADVVEAMSSHRPYRPGLGLDRALAEIRRGRGTVYDPDVADACVRLFAEKGFAIPA